MHARVWRCCLSSFAVSTGTEGETLDVYTQSRGFNIPSIFDFDCDGGGGAGFGSVYSEKSQPGVAGLARVEVEGASAILGNIEPQIEEIHFLRCPAPDEGLL